MPVYRSQGIKHSQTPDSSWEGQIKSTKKERKKQEERIETDRVKKQEKVIDINTWEWTICNAGVSPEKEKKMTNKAASNGCNKTQQCKVGLA